MSDNPSIPQHDAATIDAEELLRQHSVNGYNSPHGDSATQDERMPWDTPPEWDNFTEQAPDDAGGAAVPGYWRTQLHTLSAFLQRPRKQWTVDTVLGERDFVLLYGESGHGKTHVALDLAFACATGRLFADVFTVARPLSVAYCTGEGVGGLADRLRAVSHYYGTEDVPLYIFRDIPQLFTPAQENGAIPFLAEWQAAARDGLVPAQLDILMLDTLHNATAGADENSAKDAGIVQASMRRLRDMLGCTIVLVHHAGKNGATERGSSAIRASADTVLRASKVGAGYTLACEKLKDGETWPAKAFSLVCPPDMPDGVRISWDGDAKQRDGDKETHADKALEFLRQNLDRKLTATAIAEAIGLHGAQAKNIYRDLKTLKLAGSVREEYTGKGSPALWYCTKDT